MAELLTRIPTNLTEYPNSFKRQGCFPLEAYSVFYATADKTALEAAQDYATKNAIAYVGQTLAVVTTNAEDATVVDNVTFYIIADAAGTLQEVGKATNGDGKSIVLDENGVLSLAGFEAAAESTLPQKQADGSIKWVPIDSITEGDTNTKTVIAAGDEETHVLIEKVRDDDTDTNTYKISLDLSAYATTTSVETAIQGVKDEFNGKIGAAAEGDQNATGLYAAIAEAEQRAKDYADSADADTVYDDTDVKARIKAIEDDYLTSEDAYDDTELADRVTALEKDIDDEAKAREQADADTLNSAKGYTDEQITGLDITIEKKTVNEVESDYIVIKNSAGTEVASVNAAKFVKDGMLDSAAYDKDSKKLTLTWNTDAGKNATEIELNDLIDTYTGGNGITVSTDGEIAIDEAVVATVSALNDVKATAEAAQTADEVTSAIEEAIEAENLGQYAKASAVETELGKKVDNTTYEQHVADYTADKATFALKADVNADLAKKVDVDSYTTDKATFAVKSDVEGQFESVGTRIGDVETDLADNYYDKTSADDKFATIANAATKDELAGVSQVASNAATKADNLEGKIKEITEVGGEPNSIEYIAVNGTKLTPSDDDKTVNIEVPVISNVKVSDLKDGQSFIDAVNENATNIGTHDSTIAAIQQRLNSDETGLTVLNTRLSALETEVGVVESSRIDSLEGIINGDGTDNNKGLAGVVAVHGSDIAGLKTRDTELANLIKANTDKFDGYYTKDEVDSAVQGAIDAIPDVDFDPYLEKATFEEFKTANQSALDLKANAADVYTKDEADDTFLTEAQVDARVNALIGGANAEDTITNVTNLIEFVNDNASDIAQLVTDVANNKAAHEANALAIAANTAAHEKNAEDIAALIASVAAKEVKESTEISVAAIEGEGATGVQLGIKEVNVNKLVQTEGDELILNGGSATAKATE